MYILPFGSVGNKFTLQYENESRQYLNFQDIHEGNRRGGNSASNKSVSQSSDLNESINVNEINVRATTVKRMQNEELTFSLMCVPKL